MRVHVSGLADGERVSLINEDIYDVFDLEGNGWHFPQQILLQQTHYTLASFPDERWCESWSHELNQFIACPISAHLTSHVEGSYYC